jgi:hypothetical protein
MEAADGSDWDGGDGAIARWQGIAGGDGTGWRMQCIPAGRTPQGIVIGPKAGTSMTSIRNLAVQPETPHICGTA